MYFSEKFDRKRTCSTDILDHLCVLLEIIETETLTGCYPNPLHNSKITEKCSGAPMLWARYQELNYFMKYEFSALCT